MEAETQLSDLLSEFARTLLTDFPIQAILDHLVKRIVDVLPISAAGVTLISPGTDPHFVAASDDSAMRFERLQSTLGSGPCVAAYRTGVAVVVPDLGVEERFPEFTELALSAGLVSVFTFPLRDGDRRLGALDLYRTEHGELDETAMVTAQTLADVATAYLLNAQARSDLHAASRAAYHLSLHDALTGLPNRTLLLQRLEHAVAESRRSGHLVGCMFVDLDRFKQVNDSFGHHVGDELLVAVADRIATRIRPGDTLARLSGDEFVVVCEGLADEAALRGVARRVERAFVKPFRLSVTEVQVSASIGFSLAGAHGRFPQQATRHGSPLEVDAERLLRESDAAMYQVKRSGGHDHAVVDRQDLLRTKQRLDLSRDLRAATRRRELRVEYQPIVSVASGRPVGAEALVRWTHRTLGPVEPEEFIPLAEQTGLVAEIGAIVLEQACRDRARWSAPTGGPVGVAVNVSPHQLMSPGLVQTIDGILSATRTPAHLLTIEVTETALVRDLDQTRLVLAQLSALGLRVALDDFGTGTSSLSHLRDFSADVVKVDRSFVGDLVEGPSSRYIVEAVTTLAHRLGMTVIAEGVETPEQYDAVRALGCDSYQGHLFSSAVSSDAFDTLITH